MHGELKINIFLFVLFTIVYISRAQQACVGSVNGVYYDLRDLQKATNGQLQTVMDPAGNTYYYVVCDVVSLSQCRFDYDQSPAICQRDAREPVNFYHGLGTITSAEFRSRPNGDPQSGFLLSFPSGGEIDPPPPRTSAIEFICDQNAGIGALEMNIPAENPIHDYHLRWVSAYACPQQHNTCSLTKNKWVTLIHGQVFSINFFNNGTAIFGSVKQYEYSVFTKYDVDSQDNLSIIPVSFDVSSKSAGSYPLPPAVLNSRIIWKDNCNQFLVDGIDGSLLLFESD